MYSCARLVGVHTMYDRDDEPKYAINASALQNGQRIDYFIVLLILPSADFDAVADAESASLR